MAFASLFPSVKLRMSIPSNTVAPGSARWKLRPEGFPLNGGTLSFWPGLASADRATFLFCDRAVYLLQKIRNPGRQESRIDRA